MADGYKLIHERAIVKRLVMFRKKVFSPVLFVKIFVLA